MVNYERPLSLSLLSYILWLLALVLIILSVYILFYGEIFWHEGILQYMGTESQQLFFVIGFAVLMAFSGVGLLSSASWGRGLMIGLCVIVLIHGVLVLLEDTLRGLFFIFIGGWILAYMFTSGVADVFKPIDSRKTVDALDTLESYRKGRFL
jgi:hypothetical protein